MSNLLFDPQKSIERFQAGEWQDVPDYQAFYRAIRQDQNALTLFAEKLWNLEDTPENRRKNPDFKLKAIALDKELLAAFHAKDTAYIQRYLQAARLVKKGRPQWSFNKLALVKLAIFHLYENQGQPSINLEALHETVVEWQRVNEGRATSDKTQWYEIVKLPEIRKLLAHRPPRVLPGK